MKHRPFLKKNRDALWIALAVSSVIVVAVGVAMDKLPFPNTGWGGMSETVSPETLATYRQAASALIANQPGTALEQFDTIDDQATLLQPLIRYHEAEAHIQLGDEGRAQTILKELTRQYPDTPFSRLALYALGQSGVRSRDAKLAQESFSRLVETSPKSNLSVGARYYLGQLAKAEGQHEQAADYWRVYLRTITDGTFSAEAAKQLASLPVAKTPEDYKLIGEALFAKGENAQAVGFLRKAPFKSAWVTLGRAHLRTANPKAGVAVLEQGLMQPGMAPEQVERAVDVLLAMSSTPQAKKVRIQQLLKRDPRSGGDYLLWQLRRQTTDKERLDVVQQLLRRFPNSKWAPECSWELAWHHWQTKQYSLFLKQADYHLSHYPNSVSAPRILFWKAKYFLAQDKTETTNELLRQVVDRYPHQYYAFRAKQILKGESRPWQTDPATPYPPDNADVLPARSIAETAAPESIRPLTAALIAQGNAADLQLIFRAEEETPPLIESVIHRINGNLPQSIRVMRDHLDERRKQGDAGAAKAQLTLLYPVVFTQPIRDHARLNSLDPFLVQALMRQESYFNPTAVSSSNAMGLMQLLPSTAAGVAQWEKLSGFNATWLFDPPRNIRFGTRYLRYLHERFNGNSMMAVGAYNGGPGAMTRWAKANPASQSDPDAFIESIPALQSRDYVKEVFSHYWNYKRLYLGHTDS